MTKIQNAIQLANTQKNFKEFSSKNFQTAYDRYVEPKEVNLFLPQNFQAEELEGYNKRWHDKYNWLVSTIVFNSFTEFNSEYVSLKYSLLKQYIGQRYLNRVLYTLESNGVVERNGHYIVGQESIGYKLTEAYKSQRIVIGSLNKITYARKVEKHRQAHLKDLLKSEPRLTEELRFLTHFRIDRVKAVWYINETYRYNTQEYNTRLIALHQFDKMHRYNTKDPEAYINFTFNYTKGRLYTPLTSLPRDLHKFIYLDEKIYQADMPNSQMLFTTHFLKTYHADTHSSNTNCILIKRKNNSKEKVESLVKTLKGQNGSISINSFYQYTKLVSILKSNEIHFEDIAFNRMGYEVLMALSGYKGKHFGHTKQERNEFKEVFYGELYYNKHRERLTKLEKVFQTYFKEDFDKLRAVKKEIGNKRLAVSIHKLEGRFFHKIMADRLYKHKSLVYGIKHDSIFFEEQYIDLVTDIMQEEAYKFFGRRVDIKAEEI